METVTKKQLSDRIADRTGHKRVLVKEIIQAFLDEITEELAGGNRLEFRDFGVFEAKRRKPRTAQNPRTLARVSVPTKWTVKFKVGRLMKEKVQAAGQPRQTGGTGQPPVQQVTAEDQQTRQRPML